MNTQNTPKQKNPPTDDAVKVLEEKAKIMAFMEFYQKIENIKTQLTEQKITPEEAREMMKEADLNYQKQINE